MTRDQFTADRSIVRFTAQDRALALEDRARAAAAETITAALWVAIVIVFSAVVLGSLL